MTSSPIWPRHGGQAQALYAHFELTLPMDALDFSTNLNPLGPPAWTSAFLTQALSGLRTYPHPDYRAAVDAIAAFEQVHPDQVCLTNGGSEAIFLAASLFAGQRCIVLEPAFGEYRRACEHYHIQCHSLLLDMEHFQVSEGDVLSAMIEHDAMFIGRPNNPTATLLTLKQLHRWLDWAQQYDCTLIIDEAFIDFAAPEANGLAAYISDTTHLLLLRSLTKLFTLPGLRIGYILAHSRRIQTLKSQQIPWSVNHLAAEIVPPLLADTAFLALTRRWLAAEQSWLIPALRALNFKIPTPQANFFLLYDPCMTTDSSVLIEYLLSRGIIPRHTHTFTGLDNRYLRLAIRSRQDNERLLTVLTQWRQRSC